MSKWFSSRYMLFDDDVCIGLFVNEVRSEASNKLIETAILMSSTGDFVFITRTDESPVNHLTRFVPTRFALQVRDLLQFRNTYAASPFLCERFCENSGSGSSGNSYRTCPFGRRVLCNSTFQFYPDCVVDSGHHKFSDAHAPFFYRIQRIFPVGLVSNHILTSMSATKVTGDREDTAAFNDPLCFDSFACSAADAGSACILFHALRGELSSLFSRDAYCSQCEDRVLRYECVDDCVYTINGPQGISCYSEIGEFDAWVGSASLGVLLTLRGDLIALQWLDNEKVVRHEIHLSLIDLNLESGDALESGTFFSSPIDRLRANKCHLLQLLSFREQFEKARPSFARRILQVYLKQSAIDQFADMPGDPVYLTVDDIRYTALTRIGNGRDEICRLYGKFPDHTLLSLDIASGIISATLSGGETKTFELRNSFAYADSSMLSCTEVSRDGNILRGEPSPEVARHIKSLLAFQRWAATPSHLRQSLVDSDNRASTIARASILQSHRFLVLQQLSSGSESHEIAAEKSFELSRSLHFAGRDQPLVNWEKQNEENIKNARILSELRVIADSKPQVVTDPLQYRQKVQQRARHALSESLSFLEDSAAFMESCRDSSVNIVL
jgi:hypothetical protein